MALGDRLGVLGLVMALISKGIPILWPDKKWIGWLSVSAALMLLAAWALMEGKPYATAWSRNYPIASTIVVFLCSGLLASAAWIVFVKREASPLPKKEK